MHLRLDGGIRIPGSELSPSLYATLKHAASTYNPDFYDRQRRRHSTWNVPRIITSYDETLDDQLVLPRGLLETATTSSRTAGSKIETDDRRTQATLTTFGTDLTGSRASNGGRDVLGHDLGLLVAPPGRQDSDGMCGHRSAGSRRSCWSTARHSRTSGGARSTNCSTSSRATRRRAVQAHRSHRRRDPADPCPADDLTEPLGGYGLVVVDECHHVPAAAFESAVRTIPARCWLGLTATPYRRDGLDDLIGPQLGPVRHTLVTPAPTPSRERTANGRDPGRAPHAFPHRRTGRLLSAPGAIAQHPTRARRGRRPQRPDPRPTFSRHTAWAALPGAGPRTSHVDHSRILTTAEGRRRGPQGRNGCTCSNRRHERLVADHGGSAADGRSHWPLRR